MRLAAALFVFSLAVVGCANTQERQEPNPGPCPQVFVLEDVARFVAFAGDEKTLDNVAFSGEFTNVDWSCRYYADVPIRNELVLDIEVGRGPAAEEAVYELTYFVAVTRTDRDLIAKEEFTIPVRFGRTERIVSIREKIDRVIIPRRNATTSGSNFEIAVGFVLPRDQVIYNRSGRSLKFPEI